MKAPLHLACGISGLIYFSTMVVNTKGADNPCVKQWQWQWKVPPTLEITGPDNVPDQCVGQITVGPATVTATAGVKWQVDVNNCPEPPHTRNETSVPITPVNTWELYLAPAGTTPMNGSGTTATFTTIHADPVVVQFKSDASVSSPPWEAHVAHWPNPFGVGPEITEPNLDPVTDNHFVFSYTPGQPWPDGDCNITPEAICGCSSEKWLNWSFPDISGCIKSVILGDSPYPNPTLTYSQLPVANAYFGNKTVTVVRDPDNCTDTVTVQLFFPVADDAVNHPGSGSGTKPNWVYYWRQTPASYSTYEPTYWPALPIPGLTDYVSGAWHTYIGPTARSSEKPVEGPQKDTTFDGIDYYAYVWRHEARHANVLNTWFPNGPSGPDIYPDIDDDDLPDAVESTLSAQQGGPYDPSDENTYNSPSTTDGHRYVYFTQAQWTPGTADSKDWSSPGHQSHL